MRLPLLVFLPALLLASGPDDEVKEFRVDELAAHVQAMPPGTERDYFAGILANREGHIEESIRLLSAALPSIRESSPMRAALALESLADDYTKSFRYGDASRTYDDLLSHFAKGLSPKRLQGTKDDAGVLRLLKDAPPQTISWQGPVKLKTERNVINSLTAEITVNGIRAPWLLDTGANMSVVSRSFAHRLGIKALPGHAQTESGITGLENPLQVGLIPTFEIGGATLHNVVVMILDDANLAIGLGKETYQIHAILGYPVFQSLGAIKFSHSGEFEAGEAAKTRSGGTRLYMNLLNPVIECSVDGEPLPFTFDTGAQGTNLSVRYFERFHEKDSRWGKSAMNTGGAGGARQMTTYIQPKLALGIGDKTVTLEKVMIFPTRMGADIDELYGNLGQDFVAGFESFTLDFTNMTFGLGAPLTHQAASQ